ncbi:lipase member K-like [Dermacentor silvarum]|uniref:lipase member K-like n=1 Tax=Dermacentor silvarum TaxID=543639 RepID=UPI00210071FB|nr:lipase member K-like [Dermacentor silvarum]
MGPTYCDNQRPPVPVASVPLSSPQPLGSELIVSKGYPVEEHTVVTTDGYILRIQRIPRGRNEPVVLDANYSKPVVLVMHALAVTSADFVINFPEQSLGFILADAGYDVWLGNLRGNEYTSHLTYKKTDPMFWRFSFDEMIMYDTPTMIDAVLARTNNTRLLYIGFSQGTQVLFGLLAQQPEYNEKTRLAVYAAHSPSGTSMDNIYHFAQEVPPSYVLCNVKVPVALYHSAADVYAVPEDVARLEWELPNLVRSYRVPDKHFTHYDFALGMHAADMVYMDMLELMDQYRGS